MSQHQHHSEYSHHCCSEHSSCHCHSPLVSEEEKALLAQLKQQPYLPVVRFVLRSTKSEHLQSVALAPVYLYQSDDPIEQIKKVGSLLLTLQEKGLLTLNYSQPIKDFDYELYQASDAYQLFMDTVSEAKKRPDFIYDSGMMECGSICLSESL